MKTWKIGMLLLLSSLIWGACDDEKNDSGGGDAARGNLAPEELAGVGFGFDAKTVLKNQGRVELPVVLDRKAVAPVKVSIGVETGTADGSACEGMDFNIGEKVVDIPIGDSVAFVEVDILDNREIDGKREFEVVITGVFGGGKAVAGKQNCRISVLSNAFVEFEKPVWSLMESAADESSRKEVQEKRFIPLLIVGEVSEPCTVVIGVKDSSALEYTHFSLRGHEVEVQPGESRVWVEVLPVDDKDPNRDRDFELFIREIRGGNLLTGENNLVTRVTLVSEEVRNEVAFESAEPCKVMDAGGMLSFPVVIDHVPDTPVRVRVSASSLSTAVEGEDYVIETPSVEITNHRAEVKVRVLDEHEVNADRRLILTLSIEEGDDYTYLSDNDKCVVDILNDDFPSFESDLLEVEEDSEYALRVSLPAVDHERVLKFEVDANRYFEVVSDNTRVPAGASEAVLPVKALYSENFPSDDQLIGVRVTEVGGFVMSSPVSVDLKYVPCAYRERAGIYDFKIGQYDANGKQMTNRVVDMTVEIGEWKKTYIMKGEFMIGWPATFVIESDEDTGNGRILNDKPLYRNINFGGDQGTVDIYLKTAVKDDQFWSNFKDPIPLVWNKETKTWTWVVSSKFGLRSDARKAGTEEPRQVTWFIFKDVSMTLK